MHISDALLVSDQGVQYGPWCGESRSRLINITEIFMIF